MLGKNATKMGVYTNKIWFSIDIYRKFTLVTNNIEI